MRSYFIKTPGFIMRFFSKYTWRLPVNSNEIFLTFDDGPTPEITEFVLSELKKYNAKATFFCIGKNIKKQSNTFNKIISEGHAIGNHTQKHLQGWKTNNQKYLKSVLECEHIIANWLSKSQQLKIIQASLWKNQKITS